MRLSGFIVFPLLVSTAPTLVSAQETPTERDAARSVVQKLDQLERSLDVTALVTRLTGPSAARDAVAARAKQLMDTELLALGDDITRHPEIGFEETRSVQLLTDYLRKHDFDVQMGSGGLKTAFVARYTKSSGSPNLGVILEYDALRGTRERSTVTSTRRKAQSGSPPPSLSPSTSRARRRRVQLSCSGRRERK